MLGRMRNYHLNNEKRLRVNGFIQFTKCENFFYLMTKINAKIEAPKKAPKHVRIVIMLT